MASADEDSVHSLLAELEERYRDNPDALDTLGNLGKDPTLAELEFTEDVFEYWF